MKGQQLYYYKDGLKLKVITTRIAKDLYAKVYDYQKYKEVFLYAKDLLIYQGKIY